MSKETSLWLNTMVLIGDKLKRGRAWHHNQANQGAESNHYDFGIPVEDVLRRLFHWRPEEAEITATYTVMNENGVDVATITAPDRKAIVRPRGSLTADDPGAILGLFKGGYVMHHYDEWLLTKVAALLDDTLYISSAGLLKMGAMAWVEVTIPDTITTPEGVKFRPLLTNVTSFDGSTATTRKRTIDASVCDNTLAVALRGEGETVKIKHSRNSEQTLSKERDALSIVYKIADDFSAQVAEQTNVAVSDGDWSKFLDEIASLTDKSGEELPKGRSRTMAENKRAELNRLWFHDERVTPWTGTAFGVVQAMNTYVHHEGIVRGAERAERNQLRAVTGGVDELDGETLDTLNRVLTPA